MDSVLNRFARSLKSETGFIKNEQISFSNKDYRTEKLSEKNYHDLQPSASLKNMAFVDGGESCILESHDVSLHFLRCFGHIVNSGKTIKSVLQEYFLHIVAVPGIKYQAELVDLEGKKLENFVFDSTDERLGAGLERAGITAVSSVIRKILELRLSKLLITDMEEGDTLVMDGTLETRFGMEQAPMDELYKIGLEKNILISALTKKTSLLTTKGREVNRIFNRDGRWYYPAAISNREQHLAKIYLVRLHNRSDYILRYEVYTGHKNIDPDKVIGFLAVHARDLVLPGYPYGLIRADKFARVTENEKHYLRTKYIYNLSSQEQKRFVQSVHNILDSIY